MNKKSFTLIEILVVITIIGMILLMFAPVLNKAREGTRKAECANNLRQLGIAFHMYIDDHDFRFPPDREPFWFTCFGNYLDNPDVWRCPSHKDFIAEDEKYQSYSYNKYLGEARVDIDDVISPSQCMMITDSAETGVVTVETGYGKVEQTDFYIDYNTLLGDRHSGGPNVLFVDGHVRWYRLSDIPDSADPQSRIWWNN